MRVSSFLSVRCQRVFERAICFSKCAKPELTKLTKLYGDSMQRGQQGGVRRS